MVPGDADDLVEVFVVEQKTQKPKTRFRRNKFVYTDFTSSNNALIAEINWHGHRQEFVIYTNFIPRSFLSTTVRWRTFRGGMTELLMTMYTTKGWHGLSSSELEERRTCECVEHSLGKASSGA